jgi:hypothetical protein
MRKNLAGFERDFRRPLVCAAIRETCPQFLWINLCGISFLRGKSLILIEEIFAMKILAAPSCCSSAPAEPVSSQFLWTKLCASAHIQTKSLICKEKVVEPVF